MQPYPKHIRLLRRQNLSTAAPPGAHSSKDARDHRARRNRCTGYGKARATTADFGQGNVKVYIYPNMKVTSRTGLVTDLD